MKYLLAVKMISKVLTKADSLIWGLPEGATLNYPDVPENVLHGRNGRSRMQVSSALNEHGKQLIIVSGIDDTELQQIKANPNNEFIGEYQNEKYIVAVKKIELAIEQGGQTTNLKTLI